MSILVSSGRCARSSLDLCESYFFGSPQPAGRHITMIFAYLQRIGKTGTYDLCFPEAVRAPLLETRAEWAAVRQFELLHESGNHKIYDLDPEMLKRAMLDLSRSMRAGGYRITVATLGHYETTNVTKDDLLRLDRHLQEGITHMIHMLYLEEASQQASHDTATRLSANRWNWKEELPHIGMVLGAQNLFEHNKARPQTSALAQRFFEHLDALPSRHIVHDTAIGLQLPELNGENQWNYIAHPEETLGAFNRVLGDLFDKFNGITLGKLQGDKNAKSEIKASTLHMRSYGDRLKTSSDAFYRNAATLALA